MPVNRNSCNCPVQFECLPLGFVSEGGFLFDFADLVLEFLDLGVVGLRRVDGFEFPDLGVEVLALERVVGGGVLAVGVGGLRRGRGPGRPVCRFLPGVGGYFFFGF